MRNPISHLDPSFPGIFVGTRQKQMNDIICIPDQSFLFALTGSRFVNTDTICTPEIIEGESDPNLHMQGPHGRGKRGLSLFVTFESSKKTSPYIALIGETSRRDERDSLAPWPHHVETAVSAALDLD